MADTNRRVRFDNMTSEPIQYLDLERASSAELTECLVESSCAFITGHGVPDSVHEDLVEVSREFFDLPWDEKKIVQWPGDGYWRGWQPLAEGEVVLDGRRPAVLERFEVQMQAEREASHSDLLERSARFGLWPERPAGFPTAWARYYSALARVSSRVIGAIAETLCLPEAELAAWCEEQHGSLVVNNYLAQEEPPPPGEIRQRSHTDIGGLTVLWADDSPGGLEVRLPGTAGWTAVRFHGEALLVQAGDLLARWTNNVLRANIHRVVNPPIAAGPANRRTSIVYFHYPRLDTVVKPAPSCVSPDRPVLGPIDAGAHLRSAVARPAARYREMEDSLSS